MYPFPSQRRFITIESRYIFKTFTVLFTLCFALQAQSGLISDFKSSSITCDYLVICPSEFLPSAIKLAAHRNAYKSDDVENAMAVTLNTLYDQFPVSDTLPQSFTIWYAIKFAREHWLKKPEYIVLLGDDRMAVSGFDTLSAPPKSAGLMPTFYLRADSWTTDSGKTTNDTFVEYMDYFYQTVSKPDPPVTRSANSYQISSDSVTDPFALGRIPARTNEECSSYIDKVIRFDTLNEKGAWFNNVQLSADDAWQGQIRDQLFPILLQSSERVADSTLHGFFIHKTYLSSFIKSSNGRHENAKMDFFNTINRGVRWSAYFGHANEDKLSDECYLENKDTSLFANDSTPFIMFSFSCSNGNFLRKTEIPMCESFLFRPFGGCIAYFAATIPTSAFGNEDLAKALFNLSKMPQRLSLGKAFAATCPSYDTRYYTVLGDPAILFSKSGVKISTSAERGGNDDIAIFSNVQQAGLSPLNFKYEVARRDSVKCLDDSSVSYARDSVLMMGEGKVNGAVSSVLPSTLGGGEIKYTLYVWNNAIEGRIDTSFIFTSSIRHPLSSIRSAPVIRFNRGVLSVSFPSPPAANVIALLLMDMRGVQVHKSTLNNVRNQALFDLSGKGIAKGNYLFCIKTDNQTFTGKICLIR